MPGRPKVRASSGGGRLKSYLLQQMQEGDANERQQEIDNNRIAAQEASKMRVADYENQIKTQNEAREQLAQIQALAVDKTRQDPKLNFQDAWLQAEHEIFNLGGKPISEKGYGGAQQALRGSTLTNNTAEQLFDKNKAIYPGEIRATNAKNAYNAAEDEYKLPQVKDIVDLELGKKRSDLRTADISNTGQQINNEIASSTRDSTIEEKNNTNRERAATARMNLDLVPLKKASEAQGFTTKNTGPENPQRTQVTPQTNAPFFQQRQEVNPNFNSKDMFGGVGSAAGGEANITRFPNGGTLAPMVAAPTVATSGRAESAPAVDTQRLAREAYAKQLAKTLQELGIQQQTGVTPIAPQAAPVRRPYATDSIRNLLAPNGNFLTY